MKKQLLASLLSLLLVTGIAPVATSATAPSSTCCPGSSGCPMDKSSSCAYKVLTKEECQRFCKAKAAAVAKDASLAKPENCCKLCRAIVKADPSMKPICMKLRKNCRKMKKHCMKNSCNESSSQGTSATQTSSSTSSAQTSASSSSSSPVADQSASASSTQQSSSSSTSAN
ncbi:MAG: hypothetical protein FJ390_07310 [Verrucomicrobia bacterium]|nr:hypothetical protein [Verrucomicrobiota bacterium]